MEAIEKLDVIFIPEDGHYTEGQEVKGHVEVDLNDDTVIESVTAEFYGKASIMWCKENQAGNRQRSMTSSADEERYLNQKVTLYSRACSESSKSSSQQSFVIPKGKVTYPFSIQLPFDLPQSVVATHGKLNYYVKVTLERPLYPPQTTRKMFYVRSDLDLSVMPQAMRPIRCEVSMQRSFLCIVTGSINATWRLDRMGYIPGETVKICGEIENNTKTSIKSSRAFLRKHILYRDRKGKFLHEKKKLCMVEKGEVSPGATCFWREDLMIPMDTVPSGMKGCNLMQIRYTLVLKVIPNVLSKHLQTETDLIVGTTHQSTNQRHSTASRGEMETSVFDLLKKLDPSPPITPVSDVPPSNDMENSLDMTYFV